jgi:hypothetical protein
VGPNTKMKRKYKYLIGIFVVFCSLSVVLDFATMFKGSTVSTTVPQTKNEYCARVEPYPIPEQLKRAVSFIIERYSKNQKDWYQNVGMDYLKMKNCIDISFTNLNSEGAEGMFSFDESVSTPERLVIQVDQSYINLDELSTALLLTHELTHARQFVREYFGGPKLDCVQKETEAYAQQTLFSMISLTKEEQNSLTSRIETGSTSSNQVRFFEQLVNWGYDATKGCTNAKDKDQCFLDGLVKSIKSWVISQSAYKEQCGI